MNPLDYEKPKLVCGRFSASPFIADRNAETGETRYEVSVGFDMGPARRSGFVICTERELDDLTGKMSDVLVRKAKETPTGHDTRCLRELGWATKDLLNNYIKQGRGVEAWVWERGIERDPGPEPKEKPELRPSF